MNEVTIHTYGRQWNGARIVRIGKDTYTGERDVYHVCHPQFGNGGIALFYTESEQGKHFNIGNRAFWVSFGA